jgi:hypothetical protein
MNRLGVTAAVLLLLLVTSPVTVPWLVWLSEYRSCGRKPVIASKFAAGYWYALPSDPHYDPGIFPMLMPEYFCTQTDAKAHGYHHAP